MNEIKRKKDIGEIIIEVINRLQEHKDTVISVGIIFTVIAVVIIYFLIHYSSFKKSVWEKISIAEGYVYNNMPNDAIKILDEIINESPNSKSKHILYVKLLKGDVLYNIGNYKDAIVLYKDIINAGKPPNIVPFAYSGLGYSYENIGNYPEAITIYTEFLEKFGEHFYAPRIYESLARVYTLSGSLIQAKQTYEKIITLYPGTNWAKKAQEEISKFPQEKK